MQEHIKVIVKIDTLSLSLFPVSKGLRWSKMINSRILKLYNEIILFYKKLLNHTEQALEIK